MKAVIQRVTEASVRIEDNIQGKIQEGMVVLLGIEEDDQDDDFIWMAKKITTLRIFNDEKGIMNHSISQEGFNMLVISQFTLCANTHKGHRPSYIKAARPEKAKPMYLEFCRYCSTLLNKQVEQGIFGANMQVKLINDGPVTILLDSKNK